MGKRQRGELAMDVKKEQHAEVQIKTEPEGEPPRLQPKRQRRDAGAADASTSAAPRDQAALPPQQQPQQQPPQQQQQQPDASAAQGEAEPSTPRGAARGSPPTTPAKFAAALVPGANPAAAASRAVDDATAAVIASLTLRGCVAEGDELVALFLILRALRSCDEQLACEAAEGLVTFLTSIAAKPEVLQAVKSAAGTDSSGAIPPLVELIERGSTKTVVSAATALNTLQRIYCCKLMVCRAIIAHEGAVVALLRTVDANLTAGSTNTDNVVHMLSLLVLECIGGTRVAHALADSPALVRAVEQGPARVAHMGMAVLASAITGDKQYAINAMATEATLAALGRWARPRHSTPGCVHYALYLLSSILKLSPASFALFERQGMLEAVAEANAYGDTNCQENAARLLNRIARTEAHRGAVANAVATVLHACPVGDNGQEPRQRLRAFLAARPFAMQPFMIDALLRSAGEAARLRAEVAALEAMPVNTRAAIVELAAAARGGSAP